MAGHVISSLHCLVSFVVVVCINTNLGMGTLNLGPLSMNPALVAAALNHAGWGLISHLQAQGSDRIPFVQGFNQPLLGQNSHISNFQEIQKNDFNITMGSNKYKSIENQNSDHSGTEQIMSENGYINDWSYPEVETSGTKAENRNVQHRS